MLNLLRPQTFFSSWLLSALLDLCHTFSYLQSMFTSTCLWMFLLLFVHISGCYMSLFNHSNCQPLLLASEVQRTFCSLPHYPVESSSLFQMINADQLCCFLLTNIIILTPPPPLTPPQKGRAERERETCP